MAFQIINSFLFQPAGLPAPLPSPGASHNPAAGRSVRLPGSCSLPFPETRSRLALLRRGQER